MVVTLARETKTITLGLILGWIFGVLFGLAGIGAAIGGQWSQAIVLILMSLLVLPATDQYTEAHFGWRLSRGAKILFFIILLAIYGAIAPQTQYATSTNTISAQNHAANSAEPEIYHIGDKVQVGGFAYTFHSVSESDYVGNELIGEGADGKFLILRLTVENTSKSPKYFSEDYIRLMDFSGRVYSIDTKAMFYLGDDALLFEELQPGVPKSGVVIFDVPPDFNGYVVVSGGMFSGEKKFVALSRG